MLQVANNKVMLGDTAYSVGKKLVQVYIPAVSALYFGLNGIWGLPAVEQVVGTLAVIATFLGVCLGVSSKQYDASEAGYDGHLVVNTEGAGAEQKKVYSLEIHGDIDNLDQKKNVNLKVNPS